MFPQQIKYGVMPNKQTNKQKSKKRVNVVFAVLESWAGAHF